MLDRLCRVNALLEQTSIAHVQALDRLNHLKDLLEQTSLFHARALDFHGEKAERALNLSGQIAARQVQLLSRIERLSDAEFRVHSQWGEDGIVEWLVSRLPEIPRSFVEFGVQSYAEANTRFLMRNRGWRGLVMDGNASNVSSILASSLHWMHDLVAVHAFVTVDNINDLIVAHGFSGDLGILSIDIDGNDYRIYEAINCVNPAILILEYNAVLGDLHKITVPYAADFERSAAHYSCQYFGASFAAMRCLAEARGYQFVGTNSNGVNAFFVRSDLAGPIISAIVDVTFAWPQRHRDSRNSEGSLTYASGVEKASLIADLPVYDVEKGENVLISEFDELYSINWLQEM